MKGKKTTRPTKASSESVLDDSIDLLALGLIAIRAELEAIKAGTAAPSKHDRGSRIAFLTQRVGAIADSVRKVEAARERRIAKLTPGQVLAFLRALDADARASILREATRIDQQVSVLG